MKKVFADQFIRLEVETVEDNIKIFTIILDDGQSISLNDIEIKQLEKILTKIIE